MARGRDEDAPVVDVAAPGDCLPADFVAGLMLAGDRLPLACGPARLLPACAVELTAEEAGPPAVSWPESVSADATAVPVVSPTPMMAAASPPMPHRPALTVIVCVYVTAARVAAEWARPSESPNAPTVGSGPAHTIWARQPELTDPNRVFSWPGPEEPAAPVPLAGAGHRRGPVGTRPGPAGCWCPAAERYRAGIRRAVRAAPARAGRP